MPISMQAWALLAVTVSDHARLPIRARKELILTIIFFVCFGAQSGCTAGWCECLWPQRIKLCLGCIFSRGWLSGLGWLQTAALGLGALRFQTLKPLFL